MLWGPDEGIDLRYISAAQKMDLDKAVLLYIIFA